jgi:hypothetical protein
MVGFPSDGSTSVTQSMSAAKGEHARDVARAFAEIIRDDPVARELWVTVDTEEAGIHLWLITDAIDMDTERHLFGLPMDRLLARFPREIVWLQTLNPRTTIGDVRRALRSDAERISLHAD